MAVTAVVLWTATVSLADAPLARLRGSDFAGGAGHVFGTTQQSASNVNFVYAAATGEQGSMRARFRLQAVPAGPHYVHIKGMDDDDDAVCPVEIRLNDVTMFAGPSGFPRNAWTWKRFAVPDSVLKVGDNELVIANTAKAGKSGMPPWFMVALVVVAGDSFDGAAPVRIEEDFRVDVPATLRELPEPLPAGQTQPGFKIRGTKGWMWTPEQYLSEIPVLKQYKMNFLMNCYGSMCDLEHYPWGDKNVNRWWEPLPAEKKAAYERVVKACQDAGIDFCFSMNPNLCSKRFVSSKSSEDIDQLFQHYAWMQGLGVRWFNVSLDDISQGIDAGDQAAAVNEIFHRLRAKDPQAQMVFCPTFYWGTCDEPKQRDYLAQIAGTLDKDVYVFWTGDGVVGQITRAAAETYKSRIQHRMIVWDNYPVNDHNPTLHLGPVIKRDADLCEVVDGIMGNPLCPQNEINRIPLITLADYAYNPRGYDPARSIGQAILHLTDTPAQRQVLKELVELYPGMLLEGKGTNYNAVLTRFDEILARPHSRFMADLYLQHAADVARRLDEAFPDRFKDAVKTLTGDVDRMKAAYREKYGG
jgi:hypothetical protein